ncbi:MAG: DALR anticodon-binding domain-containing protein, partial [Janthinobacterium lividum]
FYADCPVLAAGSEAERGSRLSLCQLARTVLAKALWLLGIAVPARM